MDIGMISIPLLGELKDNDLPLPEDYNYWKSRENRTFFIDYEIGQDYQDGTKDMRLIELCKTIIQMNMDEKDIPRENLKPIYIYICTYGGDMMQAESLCDICLASRIPIVTVGMGAAMSAGFLVLLAGHKRYAFKHCQMLVHSGYLGLQGTFEQVEEAQKNQKKQLAEIKDYILSRTQIDEKTFNRNKSKDWYLRTEEVIQFKVIDKYIDSFEEIM